SESRSCVYPCLPSFVYRSVLLAPRTSFGFDPGSDCGDDDGGSLCLFVGAKSLQYGSRNCPCDFDINPLYWLHCSLDYQRQGDLCPQGKGYPCRFAGSKDVGLRLSNVASVWRYQDADCSLCWA